MMERTEYVGTSSLSTFTVYSCSASYNKYPAKKGVPQSFEEASTTNSRRNQDIHTNNIL